jgi:hypothetical protein
MWRRGGGGGPGSPPAWVRPLKVPPAENAFNMPLSVLGGCKWCVKYSECFILQLRVKNLFKTWWRTDKAQSPYRGPNCIVQYEIRDSAIMTSLVLPVRKWKVLVARKCFTAIELKFLRYRFYLIHFFRKINITTRLWSPEVGDRPPECHILSFVFRTACCLWDWSLVRKLEFSGWPNKQARETTG